jgi:hypothetical protein
MKLRKLPLTRSARQNLRAIVVAPILSPNSKKIKKAQESVAQEAAFDELLLLRSANGGRKLYGDIKRIVKKYKERGFNVERHHIEYRMELRKQGKSIGNNKPHLPVANINPNNGTVVSDLTETDITETDNTESDMVEIIPATQRVVEIEVSVETTLKRKGGRKKGSTNKSKQLNIRRIEDALTEASSLCLTRRNIAKQQNKRLPPGSYINIVKETENKYGLNNGTINVHTVKSRVQANNPTAICPQKISPVAEVEHLIVQSCLRLASIGEAFTKTEVMGFADDILADSKYADNLVEFCDKRNILKNVSEGKIVGTRWYVNFMKRHQEEIKCKPCRVQDRKRLTWCTYSNFSNMYKGVYESMVDAGVAIKHNEEVWLDINNQVTINQDEAVGRKTKYQLTKPERCVYVDETGCNTNMKVDGHVGGTRYIMSAHQSEGGRTGVTSDIHFTLLAFTLGNGQAIMCAIVMKSEKDVNDLPLSWKLGIDITKNVETGETLLESFDKNMQTKASIGGPKCTYNGITIPCFVCATPNASITSEYLVEMLRTIDNAGVFPRNENDGIPFLLIDGHHSRTRLPFLNYINDPDHLWKVCIGVPYATHLWQPHDSSELNGTFKTAYYKAKDKYLQFKPESMQRFVSTDVIPLVNMCWTTTLGNVDFAKKSMLERGWTLLNYYLLDDP